MFKHFQKLLKECGKEGKDPSFILILDTGFYTVVSGDGDIFFKFCKTKTLGNYTGRNVRPRFPSDDDYLRSRLRCLPFDYCFNYTSKDVDEGK